MHPEEYRSIVKSLEAHYQEFQRSCTGSEMFAEEEKRSIETQYTGAQQHYDQLVIQLPAYSECITPFSLFIRFTYHVSMLIVHLIRSTHHVDAFVVYTYRM